MLSSVSAAFNVVNQSNQLIYLYISISTKSINKSINQSTNQSTNQSINKSINYHINKFLPGTKC